MRLVSRGLLGVLLMTLVVGVPRAWSEPLPDTDSSTRGRAAYGNPTIAARSTGESGAFFLAQAGGKGTGSTPSRPEKDSSTRSSAQANKSEDSEKIWRSDDLDVLGIGIGVGDVDGDGKNEIVVISPSTVYLYRLSHGKLELVTEYSAGALELKSVDVAKMRKQGPARIYVSAQNRGALASFVLEYRNGVLEPVVQDFRYFLRVIQYPTYGPILLGQQKGLTRIYDGPVMRLEDKGNQLEVGDRFGIPLKIPIFGFTIGDLEGKHTPLLAAYDKEEHLRIYNPAGKRLYVSKDYFGGSDVILRWGGPEERREADKSLSEQEKSFFRPRIMCLSANQKAAQEILAISHSSKTGRYLSRSKMLEDGKVCGLEWNGDAIAVKWKTPPIQGMVTDFAIDVLPGLSGQRLIVLERKKTDWLAFLRSKSQVKAYDVPWLINHGPGEDVRD
jgi:hypothetical protein